MSAGCNILLSIAVALSSEQGKAASSSEECLPSPTYPSPPFLQSSSGGVGAGIGMNMSAYIFCMLGEESK